MSKKKISTDRRIKKLEEMIQEVEEDIKLLEKDKKSIKHPKVYNFIEFLIAAKYIKLKSLHTKLNKLKNQEKF